LGALREGEVIIIIIINRVLLDAEHRYISASCSSVKGKSVNHSPSGVQVEMVG
jgi:hypothetical protein